MKDKIKDILLSKDKIGAATLICEGNKDYSWETDFGGSEHAIFIFNETTGEMYRSFKGTVLTNVLLDSLSEFYPDATYEALLEIIGPQAK